MIKKLVNTTYNYAGYDVVNVGATFQVLADDNTTIIAETQVSATYNLSETDFKEEMERQIIAQINEYMAKLAYLDGLRRAIFPTSTDFADAAGQLISGIQAKI